MPAPERDRPSTRPLEIALDEGSTGFDGECTLLVWLAGIRSETKFRRGSTAHAAARRIAREHRLVKLPMRWRWTSRPGQTTRGRTTTP